MAIVTVNYFSDALSRNVTYRAIIPEQSSATVPLSSLYLLHGYTGDQNDWLEYSGIRNLAERFGLAVFMPAGENSFYFNHPDGPQFSTFIGKELVEQTRFLFPLSLKRENTLLAGLSMGGYGALLNGLVFPDTFGFIGSFSGVVFSRSSRMNEAHPRINIPLLQQITGSDQWNDLPEELDILQLLEKSANQMVFPHLFLACGKEDYLYLENRSLHCYLEEQNIQHHYAEWPGEHDWCFWNQAIEVFLKWYEKKRKETFDDA